MSSGKYVVALNDSQIMRWINELNGNVDMDSLVDDIKMNIESARKIKDQSLAVNKIKRLYAKLYEAQYVKDYVCVIMDSKGDYDLANRGFSINGVKFRRLVGTNNGIKRSTITYISEELYPEIKRRIDNARNAEKEIVPAKLEAYQSLVCSGSIPVSTPRIIVIPDCVTKFREDVIMLNDEKPGEPEMTIEKNKEIEHVDSDGFGLMSPEYSCSINRELYGDDYAGETISGVTVRYAWTKGMLFTFDFVEFARQKNNGDYMVTDAWGDKHDIREIDVVLTTSMVKLWDSYNSCDSFVKCSEENQYQFSVTKTTPHKLENSRNSNYQFLQSFEFTDADIENLCKPTIDEISDVLGMDYRKSIVFLKGMYLNADNVDYIENDFIKALMIDSRMIDDPFVRSKIHGMIKKRINMAAKGTIKLSGNYSIISGDPYALCQSMFYQDVTGLLKAGEIYHRYWVDRHINTVSCFRAPMTCHNNIRKVQVVTNDEMNFWYQYNTTSLILNAWDTTCDALNGADKDGDMFFTTDNQIIVDNTRNDMTIMCVQRKAKKTIPTEKDMIRANKNSFGDDIGAITNRITSMFDVQSRFDKGTPEYEILKYRIMCGQLYQQNSIDKAKGIISKPMPSCWYTIKDNVIKDDDSTEIAATKELNMNITASKKPYFMIYVYSKLMSEYNNYVANATKKFIRNFDTVFDEFVTESGECESQMKEFVENYKKYLPVGKSACVINRISWLIEKHFKDYLKQNLKQVNFDYTILKSGATYTNIEYAAFRRLYDVYKKDVKRYYYDKHNGFDGTDDEVSVQRQLMVSRFKMWSDEICPDKKRQCDILLDLCYSTNKSKQLAWDVCGDQIIENLLAANDGVISYPAANEDGDFEFAGEKFSMVDKCLLGGDEE